MGRLDRNRASCCKCRVRTDRNSIRRRTRTETIRWTANSRIKTGREEKLPSTKDGGSPSWQERHPRRVERDKRQRQHECRSVADSAAGHATNRYAGYAREFQVHLALPVLSLQAVHCHLIGPTSAALFRREPSPTRPPCCRIMVRL